MKIKHRVVYGPPGTGKTRNLIEEVNAFVAKDEGPVLLCSHTRAAATTAIERWGQINERVSIQTLHSFCFKALELSRAQTVDDNKLRGFVQEFGMDMDDTGDGRKYVEVISFAGAKGTPIEEAYERYGAPGTRQHFEAFVKSYDLWKKQFGYKDFNDMLRGYTTVKSPAGFRLLAIDEAQDLSPLHWRVIHHFMKLHPECRVVLTGDDDQCIYSYAGADPHGMSQFATDHPCDSSVLSQSFRVPATVHTLAMQITERMRARVMKRYTPRKGDEGTVTAYTDIGEMDPDPEIDTLILYNDKFIRKDVEDILMERATPYSSVNGFLAPLQSRAGRTLQLAHSSTFTRDWKEEERATFRKGLNERGIDVLNSIGIDTIRDKLLRGSYDLISAQWQHLDYFHRVPWGKATKIRISTIHGAKGMEADAVHLITVQSQAAIDHSFKDPDASHRLFYVGVTRARRTLDTYEGENSYDLPRQ